MKIFFLVCDYPSESNPTNSIFIHNQAKALSKSGNEIAVMLLDYRSVRKKRKLGFDTYKYDGIRVFRMAVPLSPFESLINMFNSVTALKLYEKTVSMIGKPDLIHAHFLLAGAGIKKIKQKYHIPAVITEHSSSVLRNNRTKAIERLMKKTYCCFDEVVCVSSFLKDNISDVCKKNIAVVPNITPIKANMESNMPSDRKRFTFLSVGHLIRSKRYDITIEAFSRFHSTYPDSRLIIIGEGVLDSELKQTVKNSELDDAVVFTGRVNNENIGSYYVNADCFVLPSDYETFGVVYIEALSCGVPVIATNNGGANDIVNSDNGIIVECNNIDAVTDAMFEIYRNYGKYNHCLIARTTMDFFGEKSFVERMARIYNDIR